MNDEFFSQFPIRIDSLELKSVIPRSLSENWSIADMKEYLMVTTCKNLVLMGFDEIYFVDKYPGDTKIWVELMCTNGFGTKLLTTLKFEVLEGGNPPKPSWVEWINK